MEILVSVLSSVLSSSVVLFLVQRFFNKRDMEEAKAKSERQGLYTKVEACIESIRLLYYYRVSDEIERLLNKGYATPADRRILEETVIGYRLMSKDADGNLPNEGDLEARLEKVYHLRTDHPEEQPCNT